MIIVDAHEDIAYNALAYGRDYRRAALQTRRLEAGSPLLPQHGNAVLGLPDAILGRVGLAFGTLFVAPYDGKDDQPWSNTSYKTPREAYQLAMQQLDYYNRLADEDDRVRLVKSQADLDTVLATWAEGT